MVRLRTDHNRAAATFVALCVWSRGSQSTRADLRASLSVQATADTVTEDLVRVAELRYHDLVEWCIRSTTCLQSATAGGAEASALRPPTKPTHDTTPIRRCAAENGYTVLNRGRIPAHIIDAFTAHH